MKRIKSCCYCDWYLKNTFSLKKNVENILYMTTFSETLRNPRPLLQSVPTNHNISRPRILRDVKHSIYIRILYMTLFKSKVWIQKVFVKNCTSTKSKAKALFIFKSQIPPPHSLRFPHNQRITLKLGTQLPLRSQTIARNGFGQFNFQEALGKIKPHHRKISPIIYKGL